MTIISKDSNFLTLINVFNVEPAQQQQLVELLTEATENNIRNAEGFISSSLHRSLDGTKVTIYAQWESIEAYQKMSGNSDVSPYTKQALAIAKFDPGMYEVVETFQPPKQMKG